MFFKVGVLFFFSSLSLPAYTEMHGVAPPSGSLEQNKKKMSRGFARVKILWHVKLG